MHNWRTAWRPSRRSALWSCALLATALATAPLAQPLPVGVAATAGVPQAEAVDQFIVQDFDWLDASRGRLVPVRLYLPLHAAGAGPRPLVVFSHGIGGSRRGYSYLGQHWASQGYASLHLQHVGSDRALWSGNPLTLPMRLQAAAQEDEARARVQDLSFALNQLLAGSLARRIDASRIVAAGHSYGANTALLAAGAEVERDGQAVRLRDARIKAAIVISAPPFYGEASPEKILGGILVPSLHITATDDVIRVPGYFSPATDRAGTGGMLLNPQVKAATQALSTAFLGSVFQGDRTALPLAAQRYGSLLSRFSSR